MFHRMKLKPYLLMVFCIMIILAGIIAVVSVVGLSTVNQNTSRLVNQVLESESAVKTCRIEVNQAARDLREMILTDDADTIAKLQSEIDGSIASIEEQVQIFKDTHGTTDGLAQKYEEAFDTWFQIANRALSALSAGDKDTATQIVLEECSPALSNLVDIASEIDASVESVRSDLESHTQLMLRVFIGLSIGAFIIALLLGLIIAFMTTRMIVSTVDKIRDAALELSNGHLNTQIDYDGKNEFGELANKMNFSFQELSKYVNAIDYGMGEFSKGNFSCTCPIQFIGDFAHIQTSIESFQRKMCGTLSELGTSSAQVSAGADQVADGAQALAQGATEQASSIEQLSSAISEISDRISDTAGFSQKADQLGQTARETVNRGKEEMAQLLESIHDIAAASNNIQSIIKVIDDIAFQTNILALNAAVEAARAGNAGKGFAVVADEVRSLAQKSADAAQETTQLIKNSLQHVSRGEEIARCTDAAFNDVASAAEDILGMIEKIAQASNEQADSISQISIGIDQISSVVQTNSATSEESAAASEQLSGQADIMKNLLDKFRLSQSNCEEIMHSNMDIDMDDTSPMPSRPSTSTAGFNMSDKY